MNKKLLLIVGLVIVVAAGAGVLMYRNSLQRSQFDAEVSRVQNLTHDASVTVNVTLSNYSFNPQVVKIKKGAKIVWTNKDNALHTITGDDDPSLRSPLISQGGTFERAFDIPGVYKYHCTPHPAMAGAIIVE